MTSKNKTLHPWFSTSFYVGVGISILALVFIIYEIIQNKQWIVESLLGQLGIGLLLIYFSGKPMIDERIRFLKFKALAFAFAITSIISTIANYLVTYPDGSQENGFSSYWFVLVCLLLAFGSFQILKIKE